MRKLIYILLLGAQSVFAQHLGFNGAGFFENYNEQVEQYLDELNQPFTLRLPGGAISKFHDPYNVRKGWGMTEANVTDWFERTGFDEDGNGLEKWLRKTEEQPDHSYMDDLIALQKRFPDLQVLWVLNVLNSTPEANMQAIRYMKQHGVNIVGVEAGNEVYGKYASFQEYVSDFEPIFTLIRKEFPEIKLGLVAGANISRKELARWNDDMSRYQGAFDAVIPHYYYTARELGEAYDMIPLRTAYDPSKENKDLQKAYAKAAALLEQQDMLGEGTRYLKQLFPTKEVWITEWNTKPSEMLSNTLVNGGWQFEQIVTLRDDVSYLLIHNGVGPDKYCAISKAGKYDSEPYSMLKRMSYYALLLGGEAGNATEITKEKTIALPSAGQQEVRYYFNNMGPAYTVSVPKTANTSTSMRIHYVAGPHIYSGSGLTGYMGKGSAKSYEVKGVTRDAFTGTIPANAFGYIVITTN